MSLKQQIKYVFEQTYTLMDNKIQDQVYFDLIVYVVSYKNGQLIVSDGFNHIEAQPSQKCMDFNECNFDMFGGKICSLIGVSILDQSKGKEKIICL